MSKKIRIKQIKGMVKDNKNFYYIFVEGNDRPIIKHGWDRVILKLNQLL